MTDPASRTTIVPSFIIKPYGLKAVHTAVCHFGNGNLDQLDPAILHNKFSDSELTLIAFTSFRIDSNVEVRPHFIKEFGSLIQTLRDLIQIMFCQIGAKSW